MLRGELAKLHRLVGEATTLWNQAETLWYLIFTLLMADTARDKVDVIYAQFQTGARQRQLILAVSSKALNFDPAKLKSDPTELKRKCLRDRIGQLNATTNDLASKRNAVIHTAFEIAEWIIPPRIVALGTHKRSRLADTDVMITLASLIRDTSLLVLDLADFRDDLIDEFVAPKYSADLPRQQLGLPSLKVLRQREREKLLQQAVALPPSEPSSP
jgi:hypothetical protein